MKNAKEMEDGGRKTEDGKDAKSGFREAKSTKESAINVIQFSKSRKCFA